MELRDAITAVRQRWWIPLAGLVLASGVAYGASLLIAPKYTSSTQLFVSAPSSGSGGNGYEASQLARDRASSYANLITGSALAHRLIDRLQLSMSPTAVSKEITATAVTNTSLIDVTVTDRSAQQAFALAQSIGTEFPGLAAQLERAAGEPPPVAVTVSEPPQLADRPSSPQPTRNAVIAGAFGLLLGAIVALMRPVLDRSVRDPQAAADLTGIPVVGLVTRKKRRKARVVLDLGAAERVEDYRRTWANLRLLGVDPSAKVLTVSSAVEEEGKSTLTLNLGLALAAAGQTVTVVEANLWSPSMGRRLGIAADVGLTQLLAGVADLDEVIHPYADGRLCVITAGSVPAHGSELLRSGELAVLMEKLSSRSDAVLVEAPPLLSRTESAELAARTDGVLLAVRYGRTRRNQLGAATGLLELAGARPLGIVLMRVHRKARMPDALPTSGARGGGARHAQ